jgi:hypothetical protein
MEERRVALLPLVKGGTQAPQKVMHTTAHPAPVWCLPPWLSEQEEPTTLEERLLWWVARARWISVETVAALAACTQDQATSALWRLSSARQIRIERQRLLLTNGGLRRLAHWSGLRPARLGRRLGWGWDADRWREQEHQPEEIADAWYDPEKRLGTHRLAVFDLLGGFAAATRESASWEVTLEAVWIEREVARQIGQTLPRPDGYLQWWVRGFRLPYFLELERGSQRMGTLVRKVWDYAAYAAAGAFPACWEHIPGVLFICPSASYETRLAALLAEVRPHLGAKVPILLTHQGWLHNRHWLSPIWRAPGRQEVTEEERAALWGGSDAELMQFRRWLQEQQRSPIPYRMGGKA